MKLKELTPKEYMCGSCGCGCPAIFETDRGTYIIIGKKTDLDLSKPKDELAIKVEKNMINNIA